MKRKISIRILVFIGVIVLGILSVSTVYSQTIPPKLTGRVLTTDPNSTSPVTCLQLLLDETVTVYAVGVDDKGKVFPLSKDSVVSWSGGDVLEVKSTGSHSATVKLAKPLKAAVSKLSNHLSYDGNSFGSSAEIAQKMKELPKVWMIQFYRDPEATKLNRDEEPVASGQPLIMHARGSTMDPVTGGLMPFMIPPDASVTWKSVPAPPIGGEFKITPLGCFGVKIELIKKGNPDFGFDKSGMIKIEVDDLPDGRKREAAFSMKVN